MLSLSKHEGQGAMSVFIGSLVLPTLTSKSRGSHFASTRLGLYVRRWVTWAGAGIGRYDESAMTTQNVR